MADTVALQFVGVGGSEDFVTTNLRSDNLADDVAVGEADDETVFGRIVFVLGLADETLASVVIGFSLAAATVLDLVAPENTVSRNFMDLDDEMTYEKYAEFLTSAV